jgi:hypothetical protein
MRLLFWLYIDLLTARLHYIIPHETFFCFVFEYLDQDLKAYMDSARGVLHKSVIKVRDCDLI